MDGNSWNSLDRASAGRKPIFLCRNVRSYRKHAAKLAKEKQSLLNANPERVTEPVDAPDIINSDETQCRFNPNSYTMFFIVHKDRLLYKQNSISRARMSHAAVTKRMDSKFHHWHASWISKNGTDTQHRLCQDWLMGRYENLIPHRTRVVTDNDQTRSPYRQYNRFKVERLQSDLLTSEPCV
ncbi:paired amphipathic helix protein sin3a [Lasius niger]|uniref:Paired amphipathic helix protein sin3a n=2 Tax=Lasius TaxID=488720 RepID=A0A0J7L2D0_LASNI|nr:paired amphipathic helix protein sin3a [Lasius niger]